MVNPMVEAYLGRILGSIATRLARSQTPSKVDEIEEPRRKKSPWRILREEEVDLSEPMKVSKKGCMIEDADERSNG
jgi:hypothetical protein